MSNCLTDYLCGDDEFGGHSSSSPNQAPPPPPHNADLLYALQMTANIQKQLDSVADNSAFRTALEQVAGEQYEAAYFESYRGEKGYASGEAAGAAVAALIAASLASK